MSKEIAMNSALSPGLLVSVFASPSRLEHEAGREDLYVRNNSPQGARVSPEPKLSKLGIAVLIKVGRVPVK
jgi:hypothetical protein